MNRIRIQAMFSQTVLLWTTKQFKMFTGYMYLNELRSQLEKNVQYVTEYIIKVVSFNLREIVFEHLEKDSKPYHIPTPYSHVYVVVLSAPNKC